MILQILESHVEQFIRRLVVSVPQGLSDVRVFWTGDGLLEVGPELPCLLRLGLDVSGVVYWKLRRKLPMVSVSVESWCDLDRLLGCVRSVLDW